jgi:hypothetical protein
MEYVFGTPSLEESDQPWKRFPGESDPTREEYHRSAQSLAAHLEKRYSLFSAGRGGDVRVRGDFFGDRTQYVEFHLPELISRDFVVYLQLWLRSHDDGAWRVMIPTYVGTATAIMVYPEVVRMGVEWEADLDDAYISVAQMMRAADKSETYRKRSSPRAE